MTIEGLELIDVLAHGTGTQAGDREETTSLSLTIASAKKQARNEKLLIGSVKSNVSRLLSLHQTPTHNMLLRLAISKPVPA